MARKICLVTGSRAEYGHLRWLAQEIADDPDLRLQWLVTGSHLMERFGLTHQEIEDDGFVIDVKVEMPLDDDSAGAIVRSLGEGVIGMSDALERLTPDIVVILGDRYEMLGAASAALLLGLPIAHVHGGEVTEGAFDDAIRHAITKMAHLHFVATETYRRRVIQLGEQPDRVHHVGAPGLDNIDNLDLLDLGSLEELLGFRLGAGYFLVTYHPVTLRSGDPAAPAREMLAALDAFPERNILFTGVNADPGHDAIAGAIGDYARANPERALVRASLCETAYLSAMKHAAAVIGNSSSGVIEAPALRTPTVNIGDRQKGRLSAPSVIDCEETAASIRQAIERALEPSFTKALKNMISPYGAAGASTKIKKLLKSASLDGLTWKRFHEVDMARGTACDA